MSWLNHQLLLLQEDVTEALAQSEAAVYFSLFSDSIFPYHLCITHKHEPPLRGVLHERLEAESKATDSVRAYIEWTYGDVITLFHILHETYQKKYFLPDCMINEVLHQQLRVVFFYLQLSCLL
jgi:hypothetical protein